MLNTGFQYTPVLSMATVVTRAARSQSASTNNSSVIVPNRRVSPENSPEKGQVGVIDF
jgi:hypothetical protein